MADSKNKNPDNRSFKDRLDRVIKKREAEEKALKKMIIRLEEASASKLNDINRGDNNLK